MWNGIFLELLSIVIHDVLQKGGGSGWKIKQKRYIYVWEIDWKFCLYLPGVNFHDSFYWKKGKNIPGKVYTFL